MIAQDYDYQALSGDVKRALRREFPEDTIATTEGYQGRVRVKVVSERFNGMSERDRQDLLWEILQSQLGAGTQGVSVAIAYGTDEL